MQQLGQRGKYVVGIQPLVLASAALELPPLRRYARCTPPAGRPWRPSASPRRYTTSRRRAWTSSA
ncbi:MAG TPA: hypothetical protein VHS99_24045 [Chloroflexota bacterium]|nr:hypothetical protein [Chloroflexota bacterium]